MFLKVGEIAPLGSEPPQKNIEPERNGKRVLPQEEMGQRN